MGEQREIAAPQRAVDRAGAVSEAIVEWPGTDGLPGQSGPAVRFHESVVGLRFWRVLRAAEIGRGTGARERD